MHNLMLGSSGGGKSYESNVFHILAALQSGRLVITNMPIVVAAYVAIEPGAASLIDLRTVSAGPRWTAQQIAEVEDMEGPRIVAFARKRGLALDDDNRPRDWRVFEHEADYGSTWRQVSDNKALHGRGPFYVIDEAHKAIPKGRTRRAVEEWFAEHRHENADVMSITQSYGKLSSAIVGNVQMVYKCRKLVALGFMSKYVRVVQDGTRGEVVSRVTRQYEKKFFCLYVSHTKGNAAVESNASEVRPIWKHWGFLGGVGMFVVAFGVFAANGFRLLPSNAALEAQIEASKHKAPPAKPSPMAQMPEGWRQAQAQRLAPVAPPVPQAVARAAPVAPPASAPPAKPKVIEPLESVGLHLAGAMVSGARVVVAFSASQNGTRVFTITGEELLRLGYEVEVIANCVARVRFKDLERIVTCDLPSQGITQPALVNGQAPDTTAVHRGTVAQPPQGGAPSGGVPLGMPATTPTIVVPRTAQPVT